jgi:hypothetical protein
MTGNRDSIPETEESFEGRSPRALEAERGPQGIERADTIERVAKPWGWDFERARQRSFDASKEVARRVLDAGNAEGPRSEREGPTGDGCWSTTHIGQTAVTRGARR